MDYTSISPRKKLLIISGSLLIHLLVLILMFIAITGENPFDSSRHIDEIATILAQSPMESEEATVIFYDTPSSQEMGGDMRNEPMSMQADTPFDAYAESEKISQEIQNISSATEQLITEQEDISPVRPELAQNSALSAPGSEREKQIADAVQNKKLASSEKVQTDKITSEQKIKNAASSGIGNITMADIAKGFLKSMAQESGGKPTSLNAEQLARQRYGTRVWSILRQSYNAYRSPTQLLNDIHTHAVFVLTIDKTGKIITAELQHPQKSLDIIQIERSLLQAVYKAGLFPPIPKQFDVNTITLSYPLGIKGHEGTHMYDLIYE